MSQREGYIGPGTDATFNSVLAMVWGLSGVYSFLVLCFL